MRTCSKCDTSYREKIRIKTKTPKIVKVSIENICKKKNINISWNHICVLYRYTYTYTFIYTYDFAITIICGRIFFFCVCVCLLGHIYIIFFDLTKFAVIHTA